MVKKINFIDHIALTRKLKLINWHVHVKLKNSRNGKKIKKKKLKENMKKTKSDELHLQQNATEKKEIKLSNSKHI